MTSQMLTIKLLRGENTPWGFRLQGGKDFSLPLSIQKVNPGSLAENAGLQTGDGVLKIQGQATENMRHKEAQDSIIRAGNSLELLIQRGGMKIWKPTVTAVVNVAGSGPNVKPVTKTSLAATKQESLNIGSKHNVSAKPFIAGQDGRIQTIVNKQYNSPANIYSMTNIAETLSAQTEVLTTGAKGINFMKGDQPINKDSAVYRMVHEEDIPSATGEDDEMNFHGILSPNIQSQAFRKLQMALDRGVDPYATAIKHVETPIMKPAPEKPAEPSTNQNICSECGRLLVGVFVRVKDKNLHAECFKCSTCGSSLKNVGYFNIGEKLYCDIHAKQAARMIAPNFEPVTVTPFVSFSGSAIPTDYTALGVGSVPPVPPTKLPSSTASPSSYSNVSPVPFYRGTPEVHHVDSPTSFRPKPLRSVFGPTGSAPWAEKPGVSSAVVSKTGQAEETNQSEVTLQINQSENIPQTNHDALSKTNQSEVREHTDQPDFKHTQTTQDRSGAIYFLSSVISSKQEPTKAPPPAPAPAAPLTTQYTPPPTTPGGDIRSQISRCNRGPFIIAMGKTWCPDHFHCSNAQCRRPLQDVGFVEEQSQMYCESCYEAYLAPICAKCGKRIKGDCLNALDKQWHPDCFICNYCKQHLGNDPFYIEDGLAYCEKDWKELFTNKCINCGFPIEAGDRWVEALNNIYHSQCFKCSACHKNLEGQTFYTSRDGRPYCKAHVR
ncbi:PDZ and LIM domain protein Zasp-like [Limulus polyphemus]|uniref:PDZ and LIM domain protein Zasp-like n=1 Tax=Limulus polyphemus TaxID=6850 RepID=A0ABM1SEC8_LIMPO|nr:PDZ and LIM domain protein Zasp-like [Limulus polyphemus]